MTTPSRVAAYVAGLLVVFAGALGVGRVAGPTPADGQATGHRPGAHAETGPTARHGAAPSDEHPPGGLRVAQDGYRLEPLTGTLPTGAATIFSFRILGPDGAPVTRFQPNHEKDLHLIVVRRDLSGFQHLHPQRDAAGTWSVPLAVPQAGQYRIFADFQPAGRADGLTLGVDLPARGDYQPVPLPAPAPTSTVHGYTVTLDGDLVPGTAARLTLSVSRDGRPVTDLQPYLGAYGHLVALRAGDLAYLHVHPDGGPGDGRTAPGPQVIFHAQAPCAGRYRLYLDFQHGGSVHTAEFTVVAGVASPPPVTAAATGPSDPPTPGHDADGHPHDQE